MKIEDRAKELAARFGQEMGAVGAWEEWQEERLAMLVQAALEKAVEQARVDLRG